MKCKFEHDGDCGNSGAIQFKQKCKPHCDGIVPVTNYDHIQRTSKDDLAEYLCGLTDCPNCPGEHLCVAGNGTANGLKRFLEQPYQEDADE